MIYIRNNKLFLGTKLKTIRDNLNDIIRYIYNYYGLDYEKMEKIYENIEYNNIIFENNLIENNLIEYNNLIFENNLIEDDKYVYKYYFFRICEDNDYKNKKLIGELHNYLKLNNINKIKLINNSGMNKSLVGINNLDRKLHYWDQYIINNDKKSIRLHDLIISAYKIRSHKFYNDSEAYAGITELDINKNGLKKELIMVINFNHEFEFIYR